MVHVQALPSPTVVIHNVIHHTHTHTLLYMYMYMHMHMHMHMYNVMCGMYMHSLVMWVGCVGVD